MQAPTVDDAQVAADRLVSSYPCIDSVLLCGSIARGEANAWSDIDLVVTGSSGELTPEDLRKLAADLQDRISIIYYTTAEFRALIRGGALFMAHLKKERLPLFDRIGIHNALANLSL